MELSQGQIEKAVEWWADHLQGDSDNITGSATLDLVIDIERARGGQVTPEKIEAFKLALTELMGRFDTFKDINHEPIDMLWVDYEPDEVLTLALEKAGINIDRALPVKTMMWFQQDGIVKAKCGYGAEVRQIYPVVGTFPQVYRRRHG